MSLSKKVKVGLDETRILILGSQILLGFQFQGAFRPAFERVPCHDRVVWVVTLGLITLTVALLITPSVQHRMVEGGQDTKRLLGVIGRYAGLSLAPFALALGADLFWRSSQCWAYGWGSPLLDLPRRSGELFP
jgi:hypothetical protein